MKATNIDKRICITSGRVAVFLQNELATVSLSCKTQISYLVITAFLVVIRLN